VPLFGSSFTDARHGRTLQIVWQLTAIDPIDGDWVADSGEFGIVWSGYGTFSAGEISTEMPDHDGTAVLSWALLDGDEPIMQNCILFDIDGGERTDALVIEPKELAADGWIRAFTAQEGNKLNGLGTGEFSAVIRTEDIPGFAEADDLRIAFEASTRAPMTHDFPDETAAEKVDLNYMLGYRCDPGANRNSFPQTDAETNPGLLEMLIDGERVCSFWLADCPADSRGALSHHYQIVDNLLDEAGSYGQLCEKVIPSALLMRLKERESFTLTLRMKDKAGLSLFGRRSGRWGMGIVLRAE